MPDALIWWAAIEVVGLATLPIAFTFFQRLPDRGYSLAKVMGLLLLTHGLWLSALLRVLPNTGLSILMLLLAIAAGSLVVLGRRRREFLDYLRDGWRTILLMEALFPALFPFAASHSSFIPA